MISKILKEEVHPDYDFIEEGEELFPINPKQVVMILNVLKKSGINYLGNKQVRLFLNTFGEMYAINGGAMLTKFLLITYFNHKSDLVRAVERKDTSQLYIGPFYSATMDYIDEDIDEEDETQSDDCDSCGGYGYQSTECDTCSGSGEFECGECDGKGWVDCDTCETSGSSEETDEEGDEIDCDACDGVGEEMCGTCDGRGEESCGECSGNGEIEDDCGDCDGNGSIDTEITKYTNNSYSVLLIDTKPLNMGDYGNATDVFASDVLYGNPDWYSSEESFEDASELEADMIEDFHSEDIIIYGEANTSYF